MNARKVLARIIERMFPEAIKRHKMENEWRMAQERAKRTAIQAMLDADHGLRAKGCTVEHINARLSGSMNMYKLRQYGTASSWAEMEVRKPDWAVNV